MFARVSYVPFLSFLLAELGNADLDSFAGDFRPLARRQLFEPRSRSLFADFGKLGIG
jgi:hypothetical protein